MAKCKNCKALMAVLKLALVELEWGDMEMRGCPPEHWKDTLAKVREAVGKPSAPAGNGE